MSTFGWKTIALQAAEKLDLNTIFRWNLPYGADVKTGSGCSKRPSSKAAGPRLTLVSRFTVLWSDTRTPLADFFSILLAALVVVEIRPYEAKEAITIEDGYRESTKRTSDCS